ncbi:MAG: response regulator [Anaerolineae bacterium]|nr:response regulator [Anaerolineae bacterium]NIN98133.1 response regulator [Anaerolineae bacterium]NIQ81062.1 response regulator [Anaerolineae bacterium]
MNPRSVAEGFSSSGGEGSERPHVLVVDDDQELLASLERGLSASGFDVGLARDSGDALVYMRGRRPDVIVLDIMMPGMDGLSLCQVIRETEAIPIIMLTALDSVRDRIAGIKAGADDYLVKPFVFDELVVRIQALLRRSSPITPSKERLSYADLTLDRATWTARRGEETLALTATEFRLLEQFLRAPGQVRTREELLLGLWGEDPSVEAHVVDVHVANLRLKLDAAGGPPLIQTIRGVGYILKKA